MVTKGPNIFEMIDWVEKKRKDNPGVFLVSLFTGLVYSEIEYVDCEANLVSEGLDGFRKVT